MSSSLAVLFALLVAVPALLIPLWVIGRARHTLSDRRSDAGTRRIARLTIAVMALLMAFGAYAALAVYSSLRVLAGH